jgi:hypothetical protein
MTTHCQNLVEALHSTVAESNKSIGHQHPLLMNDAVMQVSKMFPPHTPHIYIALKY